MVSLVDGDNPSKSHLDDTISEHCGILAIVCDINSRQAERTLQTTKLSPEHRSQIRIETGQRLVEQEQPWLSNQGAGEGDALLLPSRQLVRISSRELFDLHEPQDLLCSDAALGPGQSHRLHDEVEVLANGKVRPEREVLKHKAQLALVRGHERGCAGYESPRNPDLAGIGSRKPRDEAQQRRLPAAARPEYNHAFAGRDIDGYVIDRHPVSIPFRHARQAKK